MNKLLLLFVFLISACSVGEVVNAQNDSKIVTIYLVRHSEKEVKPNASMDPPLTQCGEQRSENLSSFLRNIHLDDIYSTD